MKKQNTVFITIVRGIVVANILRNGTLDILKSRGAKVVIFVCNVKNKKLPDYFRKEFEDENTIVEVVDPPQKKWLRRKFFVFVALMIYDRKKRSYRYTVSGWGKFTLFLEGVIFVPLSKIKFVRRLARYIEQNLFKSSYGDYFDKYNPDVVFSTSIISSFDSDFLKEAKRRKIKTVGMSRGWDNVTKIFYRVVPDCLIVQNEIMRRDVVKFQDIRSDSIVVTGFPQFDQYTKKDFIIDRKEYMTSIGLDPSKKFILWGSSWSPHNKIACEDLIDAINSNIFVLPVNMLIRTHFKDAENIKFKSLEGKKNVAFDNSFATRDFFWDNRDPSKKEMRKLANALYHADVVITQCSTLTLDAFCLNKPVINTAFKSYYDEKGNDISIMLYDHDHYHPILDIDAVDLVRSEEELTKSINNYFLHPEYKADKRREALDLICYKTDGCSSKRIADEILSKV